MRACSASATIDAMKVSTCVIVAATSTTIKQALKRSFRFSSTVAPANNVQLEVARATPTIHVVWMVTTA
jgi:hypothetical protein